MSTQSRSPLALRETRRVRSLIVAIVAAMLLLPGAAAAAPGDIGYQDGAWTGTSAPTSLKRHESHVWFNDGVWWGYMWDSASNDFHIFRLDPATQSFVDTGTPVDLRSNTHADVLWDGQKLYVASHGVVNDGTAPVAGTPAYLYRFSYSSPTKKYTIDTGFPVVINDYKTETLVIDKDSTGKLWATWMQDNAIYLNRTVGNDQTWGTPFAVPAAAAAVSADDNSSLVAFGNKIGVMWSNQTTTSGGMYFAVHNDGDPDDVWQPSRTAIAGKANSDDHINLKSMQSDDGGRVYAMVKTSLSAASAPQIMLLVRDPVTSEWSSYVVARVSDCPNRAIVVVDEQHRRLHALYTAPGVDGVCREGGDIYEKTSSLDLISFPVGAGRPVIREAASSFMHNVTSTKQSVSSRTGLVALAVNPSTKRYWHHFDPLLTPTPDFTATPLSGTAPLAVSFTDASAGGPTAWSWNFGDGSTSTAQNPTHTYTAPGTYDVTLTASNATGDSAPVTKTGYVTVAAAPGLVADFSASPLSGTAPLAVSFTDASAGGPTAWSWNFGDGSTSTAQNPTHTYTAPGTYDVTLTASNATGDSASVTKTGYVRVLRTVVLTPVADTDVASLNPTKNFGTASTLRVRLSSSSTESTLYSYLKFDVSGLTGTVLDAKLRMLPTGQDGASPDSGSVHRIDTGWTETGVTWNNAPVITGTPLAGASAVSVGVWKEWNLDPAAVPGNGTYAFGLRSSSANMAVYSSRETTNKPQLVLTLTP
jgi:PKD repeat protein